MSKRPARKWTIAALLAAGVAITLAATARQGDAPRVGKQADGSFIVSSGQRIAAGTIAFDGRATDPALHPSGKFFAVVAASRVFLARPDGVISGSEAKLPGSAAFHGVVWSPDGTKLYVSVSNGVVQELTLNGETLTLGRALVPKPAGAKGNPNPGGMAITRDGGTLYVADNNRNTVAEIDLATGAFVREFPTQNLPFEVKLSADERTLIATDWGGVLPSHAKADGDDEGDGKFGVQSGNALVVADRNGSAATGTLELIDRATGATRRVAVGLHPTDIAVAKQGDLVYVANAASDTISVVDASAAKVTRTIALSGKTLWGKMPCALALSGDEKTLYACDGGDNALATIDLAQSKVTGFWPAGYFPIDVALSADGRTAFVVNTKGNGSVRRTAHGKIVATGSAGDTGTHVRADAPAPAAGNAHDFEGTVSVIDLAGDRDAATRQVTANNGWDAPGDTLRPKLAVYRGAIQHVIYIIKENRSYDEVFGDLPEGDGDSSLCDMGEKITPNAHALARTFTLFDNGYVSGTNSADGHCWTDQAVANDYLEHLYTDYRTYPDGEDDAMAIDPTGCLWDAALKRGKSVRVYGEASDYSKPDEYYITPPVKSWLDLYHDRLLAHHTIHNLTRLPSLKPLKNPNYLYWPLLQPDQSRADIFLQEYNAYSRADAVPNLMVLSLPCDHTEGTGKKYPKPKSMVADNDLALGRIVEGVSHSPQWASTCILVIEDDAQAGLDHVDGHRTVFTAYSPYVRRHFVDSHFYSTVSMLHTIELMLGLDPMNRFDATAPPLAACFTDTPDPTPYVALPANIPLDDMNAPQTALRGKARYWAARSDALDWSGMDRADAVTLSQILWHDARGLDTPYPHGDPKGYAVVDK